MYSNQLKKHCILVKPTFSISGGVESTVTPLDSWEVDSLASFIAVTCTVYVAPNNSGLVIFTFLNGDPRVCKIEI